VGPCTWKGSINNTLGAASAAVARAQQNDALCEACWQQQQRASGAARKLARGAKLVGNNSNVRSGWQE